MHTENTVLALVNHKGGPGKTTTSYCLARHWQRASRNPFAIDLDPQGNLTRMLGGCVGHNNSIGDVLMRRTTIERAAQLGNHGIRFVGADIKLEDASAAMQTKSPNHHFLQQALRNLTSPAGVAIVDCPPSVNILTINALVAADYVVIVTDPELDAIDGMRRIRSLIAWLGEELGQAPTVLGAIVNKVQPQTVLHRTNLETILGEIETFGIVPYRRGVDADQQIDDAFAPIAAKLWTRLEETANA